MNYACPIWTPNLSDTNWNDIQTCQNSALRIATGCVKMSKIDHLHSECKIMPAKDHSVMLAKQFLLSTQQSDHPNKRYLLAEPPPRLMKLTLSSRFSESVLELILEPRGDLSTPSYKAGIKSIHTLSAQNTIDNQTDNQVIQSPAPDIHPEEKSLPRKTRTTLAQLRSGYSPFLQISPHKFQGRHHRQLP